MPRKKAKKNAAKIRINKQVRDLDTGQFEFNDDKFEFTFSEDSSDDDYIAERFEKLNLVWFDSADNNVKKTYTGNSRATYFRKYGPSGAFTKAAKLSQPINNFFNKKDNKEDDIIEDEEYNMMGDNRDDEEYNLMGDDEDDEENSMMEDDDEDDDDEENDMIEDDEEDDMMEDNEIANENEDEMNLLENEFDISNIKLLEIENILSGNLKKISAYDYLRYKALHLFFKGWQNENLTKTDASLQSAKIVYNKGSYKAQQIRNWAKYWVENGSLPKSLQGCHQKIKSLIDDEDIIEQSLSYIRKNKGKITPNKYKNFIEQELFPQLKIEKTISNKTSRIWLRKLGLVPQLRKKGIYFDGHEREDVTNYREIFLKKMAEYEKLMPIFEGENMEQHNPEILNDEKLHILVTHDECLFYSNDDRPVIWAPLGELPLKKKGQGKSIMVSEFLLETIGRLKLNDEQSLLFPNIPTEARKYLKPGKNEDGWWTAEHLLDQVLNYAIPIFEIIHPNSIAIFAFDNSTNHGAMAKDALNVSKMNVNPGGKQSLMRSTVYGTNQAFQSMVFSSDHPIYPNQAKGMKQILIERGLYYEGLIGDCQLCKEKIDDITRTDCCMRKILSLQNDFISQKSQLQEEIEKRGHKCIFYPKYHCELNYIEMYWGAAKKYTRDNCNYTWSGLQITVPKALDSVPLITIRKFARKSWRYMDIYRKGITGKLAEFAVKKYKSHRRVPDTIYNEI